MPMPTRDQKVFVIVNNGGCDDVRAALLARNWREVKDPDRSYEAFNLKWGLRCAQLNMSSLKPYQVVNHFKEARHITTKSGLLRTLRMLPWYAPYSSDGFFPRCHDLHEAGGVEGFEVDFKHSAAASILRRLREDGGALSADAIPDVETARLALNVCRQQLGWLDYLIREDLGEEAEGGSDDDDPGTPPFPPGMTDEQWAKILECPCFRTKTALAMLANKKATATAKGQQEEGASGVSTGGATDGAEGVADHAEAEAAKNRNDDRNAATQMETEGAAEEETETPCGSLEQSKLVVVPSSLMDEVCGVLEVLEDVVRFPCAPSEGLYNAWVLKPAGKSRGRNIRVFNNLAAIQHHLATQSVVEDCEFKPIHLETGGEKENKAAAKSPAKKTQGKKKPSDDDSGSDDDDDDDDGPAVMRTVTYIAQRYVEKPLLPMGRKMDIRQWVLVTDWQPLTVWFYRDCYIRFAAEDYELQDLDNLFMHLTNNSVAKHSDSFETGQVGDLNMWHSNVMAEWLHKQGHGDAWCDRITPAMKHAVKSVMLASQGCIEPRKNSYELYGFDFLLDEQLNVWLLEVNCSPTLEHSTPVTSQLIPAMVDDLMKVVVDVPEAKERRLTERAADRLENGVSAAKPSPSKSPSKRKPPIGDEEADDVDDEPAAGEGGGGSAGKRRGPDTGGWVMIHKGDNKAFFSNLCCKRDELKLSGKGLSTVHPADVKEKRTAQRAFQKTQWAALDASMASNSKRRAREAEQEASRHASLAAQAAKARAKEIKRRESSGLYKLAPEFRAQQQVEAEPAANELGGRSVKSSDDSLPNVSTAEEPAASVSPRKPEPAASVSPRKPEPNVVVVASEEDPQMAGGDACSQVEEEPSVQVSDDVMMAPGTPSPRGVLPPVWPPPKREASTQQSTGVTVSRISMGLEVVGGYATTTFTAPSAVNSFAGRSLQQHAAAAGSSLAEGHAATAAAVAAAVAREAWEQTAAETAEIRADIAARQQRSTDPSLGPQPSSGEPSVSRMYYSSLEPPGGLRAGSSGPPTLWWTQHSHEQALRGAILRKAMTTHPHSLSVPQPGGQATGQYAKQRLLPHAGGSKRSSASRHPQSQRARYASTMAPWMVRVLSSTPLDATNRDQSAVRPDRRRALPVESFGGGGGGGSNTSAATGAAALRPRAQSVQPVFTESYAAAVRAQRVHVERQRRAAVAAVVEAGGLYVTSGAPAVVSGAHLGIASLPPLLGKGSATPTAASFAPGAPAVGPAPGQTAFASFAAQRRATQGYQGILTSSLVRGSASPSLPSLAPVTGFAPTRRR